jgi:uncharacterized protein (DUF4415 family)
MKELDMSNSSKTNWAMVDALTDEMIERSELPPLDETFFERAKWRIPPKQVAVTVHMDANLLNWFKAWGDTYEQRMVVALRIYAEAHKDFISQPTPKAVGAI